MEDFTEGNITRQVINFSTPIMLGNVLISVYGIINMIWVGRLLGHKAVAAIAASLPIIMLMPAFLIGLSMGTNVLVAQAFGRKDTALLKKILSNSFFSSMLFCLLLSIIALVLRRQLLEWAHAPKEIEDMALSYLTVMIASLVFQLFLNWMNGMLWGLGDAATALKILSLLALFNIIFVPLFIGGIGPLPPLGVAGAAWGTALASLVTCVIGYIYLIQYNPYINIRNWDYSADWHIIREVFVIGLPASMQMIVVSLANVFIISLVNRFGTDITAAFGIGMQIDMLAAIPAISIGIAATTVSGQNLGAQKMERVSQTLRISMYYGLVIAFVLSAVLLIFPYQIGAVFLKQSVEHARVLGFVRDYYRWMAFIFPCYSVICVIQGVLRSAGDTIALLILSFVALLIVRVPLAYLLSGPLGLKQNGIWMAMLFGSLLSVGINWLYYKGGRWKKKRIFAKQGLI